MSVSEVSRDDDTTDVSAVLIGVGNRSMESSVRLFSPVRNLLLRSDRMREDTVIPYIVGHSSGIH